VLSFQAVQRLIDSLQHELRLYGYEVIETPIIEPADLFLTRAGDQLITRLFTFERYGQQLALRPEFTSAAAHRYAQRSTPEITRWQYFGPVFEDDPGSRSYQKLSLGAELIGMSGPVADAEIISLAAQGIFRQGLQDWKLVIGHTGLVRHLLATFDLDRRTERFLLNHLPALQDRTIDKEFILLEFDRNLMGTAIHLDQFPYPDERSLGLTELSTQRMLNVLLDATHRGMTMGGRTQHDIARRLLHKHQRFTEREQVAAALDLLGEWVAISAPTTKAFDSIEKLLPANDVMGSALMANWRTGIDLLGSYGINLNQVVIQPHVARNWDYYTGIVFEILTAGGVRLASGGRYDELVSLVGGRSVPAVGFAYYLDRMFDCLNFTPSNNPPALTIAVSSDNQHAATYLAFTLRAHDIPVALTDNPDERTITVTPDGRVQYDSKSYSNDDMDSLITNILADTV
jgi:ATP phosphoribosyltransferase regulatory subunit HisZ